MSLLLGAAIGLNVVSGLMGGAAARQDAKNQSAYQREVKRLATQSADLSFAYGTRSLARQETQDAQAVALEDLSGQREFMRSYGTARAVAAEMGVEGESVRAALEDYVVFEAERQTVQDQNFKARKVQRVGDFAQLGTSRLNQINQFAVQQPVAAPSLLGTIMTTAAGAVNTYANFTAPYWGAGSQPAPQAPRDPGRIYPEANSWRI
jgi:hypothetical protein